MRNISWSENTVASIAQQKQEGLDVQIRNSVDLHKDAGKLLTAIRKVSSETNKLYQLNPVNELYSTMNSLYEAEKSILKLIGK